MRKLTLSGLAAFVTLTATVGAAATAAAATAHDAAGPSRVVAMDTGWGNGGCIPGELGCPPIPGLPAIP